MDRQGAAAGGGRLTVSLRPTAGLLLALGLATGCGAPERRPDDLANLPPDRAAIVRAARHVAARATHYVRGGTGRGGGYDCSGFIAAIYARAGRNVVRPGGTGNKVAAIHAWCVASGFKPVWRKPLPGDLVFFNATYDVNGNGKTDADDRLSHAGIVESIRADGWFVMVHAAGVKRGITRTAYEWTRRHKPKYGTIDGLTFIPPAP